MVTGFWGCVVIGKVSFYSDDVMGEGERGSGMGVRRNKWGFPVSGVGDCRGYSSGEAGKRW